MPLLFYLYLTIDLEKAKNFLLNYNNSQINRIVTYEFEFDNLVLTLLRTFIRMQRFMYLRHFLWHQQIIKFSSQTLCLLYYIQIFNPFSSFAYKMNLRSLKECRRFIYSLTQKVLTIFLISSLQSFVETDCVSTKFTFWNVYLLLKTRIQQGDLISPVLKLY